MKALKATGFIISLSILFSSLLFVPAFSEGLPDVTREIAQINDGTANLVYVKTGNGISGEITIGSGKFYTVDKAQNHISRKNAEQGKTVLAAVNGGYFDAYTTDYRTYATIVQNGILVNGGGSGSRPTLGFTSTGEALIDRAILQPQVLLRNSVPIGIWSVNTWYNDPNAIMLFNSFMGKAIDVPADSVVFTIKNDAIEKVTTGTTQRIEVIPADTVLFIYNSGAYANALKYFTDPKVGNSARVISKTVPSQAQNQNKWNDLVTAVSAGPMILIGGKDFTDQNADFTEEKQSPDYNLYRAFAAIMSDGRLLLGTATVSPVKLAPYLLSIGAVDAMSLDGGGSTMLYTKDSGYLSQAGRNLSNVLSIVEYSSGKTPGKAAPIDNQTPSNWAIPEINAAIDANIVPDHLQGNYRTNITREEFCNLAMALINANISSDEITFMLNTCGISYLEAKASFNDTYNGDVLTCYRLGIIAGRGNGVFDPNASITRNEAAIILTNTANVLKIQALGKDIVYSDLNLVPLWSQKYVSFVTKAGIMSGGANKTFNPTGLYTRQEAVATMHRMYLKVK